MRLSRIFSGLSVALLIAICSPGAFAAVVTPGAAAVAADNLTLSSDFNGITFLTSFTGTSIPEGGLSTNAATYTAAVYQESAANGGGLDFVYQFSPAVADVGEMDALIFPNSIGCNDPSSGPIGCAPSGAIDMGFDRMGGTDFGHTFVDTTVLNPTVDPDDVAWDSQTPEFTFDPKVQSFPPPPQVSDVLVIRTNATTYSVGGVTFEDGGISDGQGWQPAPEPAEAGVLLGGLFAVGLFVARKFRVQRS